MALNDFLGFQEQNLVTSLSNLREELDSLVRLDLLFKKSLPQSVPEKHMVIAILFLQTYNEFFRTFAAFLRLDLWGSFGAARKGIEATLNAYHICLFPADSEVFLDRANPRYSEVFFGIKKYIKGKPQQYPFATSLIQTYEMASAFAEHSTIESFTHKLREYRDLKGVSRIDVLFNESVDYPTPFLAYYYQLLSDYWLMLGIFRKQFISEILKVTPPVDAEYATLGLVIRQKTVDFKPPTPETRE